MVLQPVLVEMQHAVRERDESFFNVMRFVALRESDESIILVELRGVDCELIREADEEKLLALLGCGGEERLYFLELYYTSVV